LAIDKAAATVHLMADDRRIPDLVSVTEAAEMLGVTRQAVLLMAGNGQLPGRKVGATWVFRRAVVEDAQTKRGAGVNRTATADHGGPPTDSGA
jgi:excisionase family DNA binding protein